MLLKIIIITTLVVNSAGQGYALRPAAERCSASLQDTPEFSAEKVSGNTRSTHNDESLQKNNKLLDINKTNLEALKSHLNSLESLKDLDESTTDKLAGWIIGHRPYRNLEQLKKALHETGIKGVKRHHQEAIAESFKVRITRRKFFAALALGAVAAGFTVKKIADSLMPVPQRDWIKLRDKIKTEKRELNQKITAEFLAVYPEEKDFVEQINKNKDIVFSDYVGEIFRSLMNSPADAWKSKIVAAELREAPLAVLGSRFSPEALIYVKQIVSNRSMGGLVEKVMQLANTDHPDAELNDFAKMAVDCKSLNSAEEALNSVKQWPGEKGLIRRLTYYWRPKSKAGTSEYAYVDLATGTNFEDFLPEILQCPQRRPIFLTDISPHVIRFWQTLSRILELDNIQILDMDIRTISRKTLPLKVGTIRLQNVALWVKDLSEEWVEQIYDLVEPGGQIIFVYPPSSFFLDGRISPQHMKLTELVEMVTLKEEHSRKLMRNFFSVAGKQRDDKWIIYAGHVGENGRFVTNQSGYAGMENTDTVPKIYDTVIVLEKRAKHSLGLIRLAATFLGAGALTALVAGVFEWHRKRTIRVQEAAENEKKARGSNPGQQKNTSETKVSSGSSPRRNRKSRLAKDMASRNNRVKSSAAGNKESSQEKSNFAQLGWSKYVHAENNCFRKHSQRVTDNDGNTVLDVIDAAA